jgi:acetolactate synthase-1/2/3 large subunit
MKYSDQLADWLIELGFTHCFFVAGGNIMHLLESCSRRFKCIPVVHEVAAGIAAEYFNEASAAGKAFALVTAGPGLTNIVTAIAGAYLESRELLVLGGQAKLTDLSRGEVRQRGIQEVDGVEIVRPITARSTTLKDVADHATFAEMVHSTTHGRKGPVFIEIPLDIQGRVIDPDKLNSKSQPAPWAINAVQQSELDSLIDRLRKAKRPILLIGGGIDRTAARTVRDRLAEIGIPLMTTWNGVDRIPADHPLYFGRPNTWGQRSSNILLQQADLLIALGTRLGLQQTGFNWPEFVPVGDVVQVDCDPAELSKGHPRLTQSICGDANEILRIVACSTLGDYSEWAEFCHDVRNEIPLIEPINSTADGHISPYVFVQELSKLCSDEDVVIPCSSGGAYTVMMQAFDQKAGQVFINNKGLASMGYGLSGAIGAAIGSGNRRTILVEGDGGFIQNLQELGTLSANRLKVKIFIFANDGYASIRMTQKNYFNGHSVGCDIETGLGIPIWEHVFLAYGIPMIEIGVGYSDDKNFIHYFESDGPAAFLVRIDPDQTYFPKISSRLGANGTMESNPLHLMTPELPPEVASRVFRFLRLC